MTAIVVPVPVPAAALPIPDSADLSTWPARMKELHRWMRNDAAPAMSALGEASYQNALHAVAMADSAAGAANFKGAWSSLTGALNTPASVSHSGRLWLLTANLANVTTATPGVSGSWLDVTNFLMGVATAAAARTALDVYSKTESQSLATNLIDNSNFSINQRGVSGTVTLAAGAYGHDRFKAGTSGCTYTFATSGGITTLTITAGSLVQVVEGANLETATYTLSQGGAAQMRIVGGAYAAGPIEVSATGGTNLSLEFGTGTVKQVKLEKGSAATAWARPIGQIDLLNCQRYAVKLLAGGTQEGVGIAASVSTTDAVCIVPLAVSMRATPTLTYLLGSSLNMALGTPIGGTVTAITSAVLGTDSKSLRINITGTGFTVGASVFRQNSGTPVILVSADL